MDALQMTSQVQDIIKTAEFIYGDKWPETKEKYKKILEKHHKEKKTKNLLASAIQISKEIDDEKYTIVLIGSAF